MTTRPALTQAYVTAARTKLKNLTREEAAKKAAAAAKSAADRSPHTKEVYCSELALLLGSNIYKYS